MSNFLRPCGPQHARFPCPPLSPGVCSNSRSLSWWCYLTISFSESPFSFCPQSFPGCMCAKSIQSCLILWDSVYHSLPGSSVHGIVQARILERAAISSSRVSSQSTDWNCVFCISHITGRFFTAWAMGEAWLINNMYYLGHLAGNMIMAHSINLTTDFELFACP